MIVFNSLDEIKDIEPCVIAVGNFDGVHLGHQAIIKKAINDAKGEGIKSAVFTFSNHPRNLLKEKDSVKNILYAEDKQKIIEDLGIDYMFNIPFTDEIRTMDPVDFIDNILLEKFKMKEVLCGFNYHFGYKAEGNVELLLKEGLNKGFSVHVTDAFTVDDQVVSSSLIREKIAEGDMLACSRLLGRHYAVEGEVVVGNRLGKKLGFPTSNVNIDEAMVSPPNGVYITICTYNGESYPSITNVGHKPTIGEYGKNVETHIFNFDKELYGKNIKVEFLKKMRDEIKFDSVEALSAQITEDCITAKAYHRQHK